jgi:hypothetical protein
MPPFLGAFFGAWIRSAVPLTFPYSRHFLSQPRHQPVFSSPSAFQH